jgi:hypothetical protein
MACFCDNGKGPSSSINYGQYLEELSHYLFLTNCSAPKICGYITYIYMNGSKTLTTNEGIRKGFDSHTSGKEKVLETES